jgi:sirohydrochlorin ferrochelatase
VQLKRALLIVDHGSLREESNLLVQEVARMMQRSFGFSIVHYAHMERVEPTIEQGFDACVADGAEEVIVHPYFLAPGRHVTADIPHLVREAASRHPGIAFRITEPLGIHPKLGEVILERITQAEDDASGSAG